MTPEQESGAAAELEARGFIVFKNERGWFCGAGSHGGSAPSLRKAMKKCLACCKLGKWWKIDHGISDMLAEDLFRDVAARHFGAWK